MLYNILFQNGINNSKKIKRRNILKNAYIKCEYKYSAKVSGP